MNSDRRQAADDVTVGTDVSDPGTRPTVSLTAALDQVASGALLAAAPDACMVVDAEGLICAYNELGCEMFGYDGADLIGSPIERLVPDQVKVAHVGYRTGYASAPRKRPMGSGLALSARRRDGSVFPVEISLSPLRIEVDGVTILYAIAAIRDVTEQTRIRERLAGANRAAAIAEDRERLARDLHDTVIQEVFAVGLSLQSAAGRIEDPTAATRVNQAIDDLDRVIRHIRTAIFGLTSHRDWGRGVRGEVLRVAADLHGQLGFEPTVVFDGDLEGLPREVVSQMLPVLKETLANVAHHADARRCDVVVEVRDDEVILSVTDDGLGPAASGAGEPRPGHGHGLRNLTRRAAMLGGSFVFGPAEYSGSQAIWTIPLDGGAAVDIENDPAGEAP